MNVFDMIAQAQNGEVLTKLASQHGISREAIDAVARHLLPELSYNIEKNTLSRGGLADVVQSIGRGNYEKYLEPGIDLTANESVESGNNLLGQILGTKYHSRRLADQTERETGVPAKTIRQLLPQMANLSMGAVAKETQDRFGDIFGRLPDIAGAGDGAGDRGAGGHVASGNASPLPIPGDNWGGGGGATHQL